VSALKDLFHNVQKNHDFLNELKRARALVAVKTQVLSKQASSQRAPAQRPAEAVCQAAAHRVQTMVLSKQASSPRAPAQRPAEAGCRAVLGYGVVAAHGILEYRGLMA
jgi:hypothetical protein